MERRTLMTPALVAAIAYGDTDRAADEAPSEELILLVSEERLVPVIGRALYDSLLEGRYADLMDEYVAPALAYGVRLRTLAADNVRCSRFGTLAPRPEGWTEAGSQALNAVRAEVRRRASGFLRRLSEYLAAHGDEVPEYDARNDVLNRCRIDGDFIQTR